MKYEIQITEKAEKDLAEAADYIEFHLLNPKAAGDLLDQVESEILALSSMPQKFKLVDDPVLHAWGIRFTMVKNYMVFFVIDEAAKTVHILRFLYGKRDWISILQSEP